MDNIEQATKEELEALYRKHNMDQIASMFGVCRESVRIRFIFLGIPRKASGQSRIFNPTPTELDELYQSMSMKEIANKFGVGETVIWKRLHQYGIKLRGHEEGGHRKKTGRVFSTQHRKKLSAANRGKTGQLNPNWRGGKTAQHFQLRGSAEYKEWKAEALRLRGNKCQECGRENGWQCECCGHKVVLHVHHIESFTFVPARRFDPTNSEVLCSKCHHRRHRRKPRELLETPKSINTTT